MNPILRMWHTWIHARKFARLGKHYRFPISRLRVEGHVEMGDYCRLRNNVTLRAHPGGRIIFGNRSGCSWGGMIDAHSLVRIGNYSGVGEYSFLCDTFVRIYGNDGSWRDAVCEAQAIVIGDSCFVGSSCIFCAGVTVGEGAVIAQHSVVVSSIGPYEIWGGAPARRIGHRVEGVPESKLREYRDLVAQYGLQKNRYTE